MRSIRIILLTLLTAGLLAGCGGSSSDDAAFKKDFKAVNEQLLDLGDTVGKALQNAPQTSDAMLAGEFSGFAGQLDDIGSRLDALKPPSKLRAKVDALATAISALSKDLRDIAQAATAHDTTKARDATKALITDSAALKSARQELARKTGAKVGS